MIGQQRGDQRQLFYLFNLESRIPPDHLLCRINLIVNSMWVGAVVGNARRQKNQGLQGGQADKSSAQEVGVIRSASCA